MKQLILIDGNSLMYRAYFATAYSGNLMKTSTGIFTNALHGFINMMTKVIEDFEHTHMLVAFDAGKTTFRHEFLDTYKAGRAAMPDELRSQINSIKTYLDLSNIPRLEIPSIEADDIIGTYATLASSADFDHIHIITGDKDLLQMVSDKVTVHITKKGVTEIDSYTVPKIYEKYELTPAQITDLKGLMGDASDNLPGIPGVGEKTAIKLLKQFDTVENLGENTESLKGKQREKVEMYIDQAKLCKKMATIKTDADVSFSFSDIEYKQPNVEALIPFYKEMEFNSFIKKLQSSQPKKEVTTRAFTLIKEASELEGYTFTDSSLDVAVFEENYHQATVIGISVVNESYALFVPFEIVRESESFMAFLADESIKKQMFDLKRATVALAWYDVTLRGVDFDLLLGAYVLNPNNVNADVKAVLALYEFDDIDYLEDVYGKGAKRCIPDLQTVASYSVSVAAGVSVVKDSVLNQLRESGQLDLFLDMELPLAFVLADMELTGMHIDLETLKTLGDDFSARIQALESSIYEAAQTTFNINSPKQLGEVLFEKLGLPVIKKTKTGYSTNAEVLEKLLPEHDIIPSILQYRTLAKLHSTYIEGLKKACYEDGKVHTIFNQAQTQTGRLSSVDPNLQNIPIRLEEGRLIRKAFVPSVEGWVILGADYSQIELRILAHISKTESLVEAFKAGEDIHTKTAMDVFNVTKDEMTDDYRRSAKAINFGIIYGMSAFGLSENLNITQKEAKKYIENYLETYAGIKAYMDDTVKDAKYNGYVATLFNRRRYIAELSSKNYAVRQFGERTAMNAPIQGTAADIIKKAMIDVVAKMKAANVSARLLSQVHDELIFEVPQEELDIMTSLIVEAMEHVVTLEVPLKVDYSSGSSWYDAK